MKDPTKIEELIKLKKDELEALKQKKRDEDLIKLGLFEKEYSDSQTKEFIDSEYYRETAMLRYYKKVPMTDVTDEQIDKILSLTKEIDHLKKDIKEIKGTLAPNTIAFTLKWVGILVYVIGAIVAISYFADSSPGLGVMSIFLTFIAGTLFIGVSEIIKLLHVMNQKQK